MWHLNEQQLERLKSLCRRYRVERLELFGSATGPRFDAEKSDLDFLVSFLRSDEVSASEQYFGLADGLELLFGRSVDLVDIRGARNPYFIAQALASRGEQPLYAA